MALPGSFHLHDMVRRGDPLDSDQVVLGSTFHSLPMIIAFADPILRRPPCGLEPDGICIAMLISAPHEEIAEKGS